MPHTPDQLGERCLIVKLAVRTDSHQNVENAAQIVCRKPIVHDDLPYLRHEHFIQSRVHRVVIDIAYVWKNFEKADHVCIFHRCVVL